MLRQLVLGNIAAVALLCASGCEREVGAQSSEATANRSVESHDPFAQLLEACASGDEARARRIVDGSDATLLNEQVGGTGATPLQRATEFGHENIVELLLSKGANPNLAGPDGNTPLMQAAYKGYATIVDLLLAGGANPNVSEQQYGDTPLIMAAWKRNEKVVEKLIRAGANVNAKAKNGRTALQQALQNKDEAMVKLLKDHGATE